MIEDFAAGRPAQDGILDLAHNEGPVPPPEVMDLVASIGPSLFRDYVKTGPLEAALARYVGVGRERVLVTTGGDDAIDRVCRAYMKEGDELVIPTPTFEMFPDAVRASRARMVPIEHDWAELPVDRIVSALTGRTRIVSVISPDNPTGVAASTEALVRLARALPEGVVMMADLAYVELADEDPSPALLAEPNVIQIRTLAKAWGLAGLRVGYLVAEESRVAELRGIGGPYPVSGPAVVVALYELENGLDRMRAFVAENRQRRARMMELLARSGGEPWPSQSNLVLTRFPSARWIREGLAAQGVRTRWFPHLPDHVRMTVPRDEAEMARLESSLGALDAPDAVLFDMDGVLADVRHSYRAAIKATCLAFGVTVTDDEIGRAKARGHANDDWALTRSLLGAAGVDLPQPEVTRRFEEAYQGTDEAPGLRSHEALIPDRTLLAGLSERFRLGVVTGRPRADAQRFLAEQDAEDLFPVVVCREDGPLKPDPAPVELALRRLGARTAWLLGDTPDDMAAALGAGVVPIGVVPPGGGGPESESLERAGAARVVCADGTFGGLFDGC